MMEHILLPPDYRLSRCHRLDPYIQHNNEKKLEQNEKHDENIEY